MSRIAVMNSGVMQGPGRPDEETRDGFTQGGWGRRSAGPDNSVTNAVRQAMSERMEAGGGLAGWLFGRRTYEELLSYWNSQPDNLLAIMGSGELFGSLMAAGLIDEYLLMINPLVLGAGRRLFPEGVSVPLRLTSSTTTPAGILITTYEPADD